MNPIRHLIRYLMLALALLAGHEASARTPFQIRCEDQLGKTLAVLTAQQGGYSIATHLSYHSLTAMKGALRANNFVLGLTKTESRIAVKVDGPMLLDAASGYECVAPQVTVTLSYAPAVIYVGSEFLADSCAYREILAHELRHLKTYQEHLPKAEAVVREALAKRFQARPMYSPRGTSTPALSNEINTGWLPYIKGEMAKVEALQSAIDSPQEYARLGKACNGEIRNIIQNTRRGR